jgi:DNA-binding response OmpR family regulator
MTERRSLGSMAPAPAPRAPRVLVADDEHDVTDSLTALLCLAGFEARGVYSGLAAQAAIVELRPDIVLLDIGLPGMSGYDVARSVRRLYGRSRPALVAVTGRAHERDKLIFRLAGFDHYVAKPYDPAALLELLESILARR